MIKVDTFFDGRYIYEDKGLYYIVKDGVIISPPFATLKDAQKNAWKYTKTAATAAADPVKPEIPTVAMIVDAGLKISSLNTDTSSIDEFAKRLEKKDILLRQCLLYFHCMDNPPVALKKGN